MNASVCVSERVYATNSKSLRHTCRGKWYNVVCPVSVFIFSIIVIIIDSEQKEVVAVVVVVFTSAGSGAAAALTSFVFCS